MACARGIDEWPKRRARADGDPAPSLAAYPCALRSAASTSMSPITTAHEAILSGCGPTHSIGVRRGLRRWRKVLSTMRSS
jgi:hypothetical protein